MRHLALDRFAFGALGTLGRMELEGGAFWCWTLEPPPFPWVPENARDVSAIPAGTYRIERGTFHRNTEDPGDDYPCLVIPDGEVKERGPGVKIHAGNTIRNTRGCPMVGDRFDFLDGFPAVLNSRLTLEKLVAVFGVGPGSLTIRELRHA